MYSRILWHILFVCCIQLRSTFAYDCYTITKCSPEISALGYNNLNQTIEIRCTFRSRIESPLDVMWKFTYDRGERMAYDADGQTMPPFKHTIVNVEDEFPNQPYSISILKVPLLNASYFTNYTIVSVRGQCYQTVRIHLKERALGLTNVSMSPQTLIAHKSLLILTVLLSMSRLLIWRS